MRNNIVFVTAAMNARRSLEAEHFVAVSIEPEKSPSFEGVWYPKLAPPRTLLQAVTAGVIDFDVFQVLFRKYLDTLDCRGIARELRQLNPTMDRVALLDGDHFSSVHRRIVGDWLMRNGYETDNLSVNDNKGLSHQGGLFE